MPYYHIFIRYYDREGKTQTIIYYDIEKEEDIREKVGIPYMENRRFLVGGRVYDPADIDEILIFTSATKFKQLQFPTANSPLGESNEYVIRCFFDGLVQEVKVCTPLFIQTPPKEKEEAKAVSEWATRSRKESELNMIKSATFLGLDANWFSITSALQLHEVAITLLAQKKGIALDRENVEKILKRKVKDLSFNEQYEAFSKQVKDIYDVDMPILTGHLRRMRAMVLHGGYNPKPEETQPMIDFTIGLLQKLKSISECAPSI